MQLRAREALMRALLMEQGGYETISAGGCFRKKNLSRDFLAQGTT
jgi:hypothetical protein